MTAEQEQSRDIFFEGIGHFEAGQFERARECFERCLVLTPGRPSVLGNLGITLFRLGHTRNALPHLQQAVAADPQFAQAWAHLGLAHEALGQWKQAADALTKALALSGQSAPLWFSQGQCLMRLGRASAALAAFDRALEIEPDYAEAWSVRGGLLREAGRMDEAAQCFERAISLGADAALHGYYLASVRRAPVPAKAPRQYVEALFDDYAADFQGHLVEHLDYHGHELLLRPLVESGQRFHTALELGCGTGLCAPLLRRCCDTVDGVDISGRMIEQARKLGLYRELVHADLGDFLAATALRADLVVAADVLIYVGEVSDVFGAVARILAPGGLFAFTIELPTNGDEDLQLLPSLRYAHSQGYVRRLAAQCGLAVEGLRAAPIRHEQSRPVPGLCVYLRRAA